MESIKNYIVSAGLFALFTIALITFGVNFGTEQGADTLITDNNSVLSGVYESVNETIGSFQSEAQAQDDGFNNNGTSTSGGLGGISEFFMESILSVGKAITGIGNKVFNATFAPLLKGIGIPNEVAEVVGGVIAGILIFLLILMAWRLYRTGQ